MFQKKGEKVFQERVKKCPKKCSQMSEYKCPRKSVILVKCPKKVSLKMPGAATYDNRSTTVILDGLFSYYSGISVA